MKARLILKIAVEKKISSVVGRLLDNAGRVGSRALPVAGGLGAFELSRQNEDRTGFSMPTHIALGLTGAMGLGRHNQRRIMGGVRGGYTAQGMRELSDALKSTGRVGGPKEISYSFIDPSDVASGPKTRSVANTPEAIEGAKADLGALTAQGRDAALADIMIKNLAFGGGAAGLDVLGNVSGMTSALEDTANAAKQTANTVGPQLNAIATDTRSAVKDWRDTAGSVKSMAEIGEGAVEQSTKTLQDISAAATAFGEGTKSMGQAQNKMVDYLSSPVAKAVAGGTAALALGWLAYKFYDRFSKAKSEEKDRETYGPSKGQRPRLIEAA